MLSSIPTVPSVYGLSRPDLARRLEEFGVPGYRATQLYRWIYQKHLRSTEAMTNLPLALRQGLDAMFDLVLPRLAARLSSHDQRTHKFVLELSDGERVEAVSMRAERGLTFCLSSQVGCALGCGFCATGRMGLRRNLKPAEIVAQVLVMGDFHLWEDDGFNLVFMGMGEPLANYRAVLDAVRILHDPRGLNLGARRITVSTCGLVPQIRQLAGEGLPLGLAISLQATTDELRDRLVPVNRRWPLREVLSAAREYGNRVGRRVTLEYVLLAGVNDSPADADRLAALARELPSKINLIPCNPVPGMQWKPPSPEAVAAFAERLFPQAPAVTVRDTQGADIWAACGQLGGLGPGA